MTIQILNIIIKGILSKLKVCLFCILFFTISHSISNNKAIDYKLNNDFFSLKCTSELDFELILNEPDKIQPDNQKCIIRWKEKINLDCFFTTWRAPLKANNGDNAMLLKLNDFQFKEAKYKICAQNGQQLDLYFCDKYEKTIELIISIFVESGKTFFRQQISIRDTVFGAHFLNKLYLNIILQNSDYDIINQGGFGQPVALSSPYGSIFTGFEYPADENILSSTNSGFEITLKQIIGRAISNQDINSHHVVIGFSNSTDIKNKFMAYLKSIQPIEVKPYTLYNSWYDLRSVEYPGVDSMYHMTEKNTLRIINLINKNMIKNHDIKLNAFVLDDGWDTYKSGWDIRKTQFPNGFTKITTELSKMDCKLGIWIGPTGGYSFRTTRIDWMEKNGYEVTGKEYVYNSRHLCLGGIKYNTLLKERITSLISDQQVTYFKLDGFQFSCSNPAHGHPVGEFSRSAIVDSVIKLCTTIRNANSNAYINLTSGTWLSPWWLMHTNQLWMDGNDHDWSEVTSVNQRDAAITYRDEILYDNFTKKNLWVPMYSLMTHGLIKGKLELLGGEDDPLDKFTNDIVFYCTRGISMYELYISPDIIKPEEWNALSTSLKWAHKNQNILNNTIMFGGDPSQGKAYGYAHFNQNQGIIALRNPSDKSQFITLILDQNIGTSSLPKNLILERIYPNRLAHNKLYQFLDTLTFELQSYETSIFEIQSVDSITYPIFSGIHYCLQNDENHNNILFFKAFDQIKEINKKKYEYFTDNDLSIKIDSLKLQKHQDANPITKTLKMIDSGNKFQVLARFEKLQPETSISFLLYHKNQKIKLKIDAKLDGEVYKAELRTEKNGTWIKIITKNTDANIQLNISNVEQQPEKIKVWLDYIESYPIFKINYSNKKNCSASNLPLPFEAGRERKTKFAGESSLIKK